MNKRREKEYLVAFMDVLGFEEHLKNHSIEAVYQTLDRIWNDMARYLISGQSRYFAKYEAGGPEPREPNRMDLMKIVSSRYFFSDSILLYIEQSSEDKRREEQFYAMCHVVNRYLKLPILYPPKGILQIAMRGGLATGTGIMDRKRRIFVGEPILNAYHLSNQQAWMGCAVHKSVDVDSLLDHTGNHHLAGFNGQIYEYDRIPLKDSSKRADTKYVLNWVSQHPAGKKWYDVKKRKPLERDIIEGNLAKYVWPESLIGYKMETIEFAKHICDRYASSEEYADSYSLHSET